MAVFMTEERALTLKDVATRLSVSERSVLRLAEEHELIGYKVGHVWRFEPAAVKDFIERQQEKKRKARQQSIADQIETLLKSLSEEQRMELVAQLQGRGLLTAQLTLTVSDEQTQ